jgi:hypothetical protein
MGSTKNHKVRFCKECKGVQVDAENGGSPSLSRELCYFAQSVGQIVISSFV